MTELDKPAMLTPMEKLYLYEILGVPAGAGADELNKAYHRLAMQYHPDKNLGDKAAEQKLQQITEAYNSLSNAGKPASAASAAPEQELRYAGLNARVLPSMVDMLILLLVAQPGIDFLSDLFFGKVAAPTYNGAGFEDQQGLLALSRLVTTYSGELFSGRFIFDNIMQLLAFGLLSAVTWVQWGGTPGMLLFRMRIVDDTTLERITYRQAWMRLLGYVVASLPLFLGFLWVVWDKRHQGLHDKIAQTLILLPPRRKWLGGRGKGADTAAYDSRPAGSVFGTISKIFTILSIVGGLGIVVAASMGLLKFN